MRAVHIPAFVKSYDQLVVAEVPTPAINDGEVLVKVSHAGLNYVDLLYVRGLHQNNQRHVKPPFVAGQEFAGTVIETRSTAFAVGDKVFGAASTGAFAEYIAVAQATIKKVPAPLQLDQVAGLAATAPVSLGALVRAGALRHGEDVVLVHAAAGGLGVMAVQAAHAYGCRVIATVGSEKKAAVVKDLGVAPDDIINYTSDNDWDKQVLARTHGKGVDLVFDSVGLVRQSIRCTTYNGRILVIGFASREGNLESVPVNRVLLKSIHLIGYRFGEHGRQFPGELNIVWTELKQLLQKGAIRPVIHEESFQGLESIPRAMHALHNREVCGKAIILMGDSKSSLQGYAKL